MNTVVDEARLRALMTQSLALHSGAGHRLTPTAAGATDQDIAMLQTAASLENLAVSTYTAALTLDVVRGGNATVLTFATTTRNQHADHATAFDAAVTAAGGAVQTNPDPAYDQVVQRTRLASIADVVTLAVLLEDVTTQTYVRAATLVSTPELRTLFGSVAAVEAQHHAILLAVGELLDVTPADEIRLSPPDAGRLPATIGSVGFPASFTPVTRASPADEGAVR